MEPSEHIIKPARKRRRIKITDILIFLVLVIVILLLANTLMHQLSLKHEVADARTTTTRLLTDIREGDGVSARKLGDASFQSKYTDEQLNGLFKQLSPLVSSTPKVYKQTANNGTAAKVVSIYYKFNDTKPYYLVVTVSQSNGKSNWQIINFSGSPTQADLLKLD